MPTENYATRQKYEEKDGEDDFHLDGKDPGP